MIKTKITLQTIPTSKKNLEELHSIKLLENIIPNQIFEDLKDVNNSYVRKHYRQSAIIFRTALESAIRIKIQQENLPNDLLYNQQGMN